MYERSSFFVNFGGSQLAFNSRVDPCDIRVVSPGRSAVLFPGSHSARASMRLRFHVLHHSLCYFHFRWLDPRDRLSIACLKRRVC